MSDGSKIVRSIVGAHFNTDPNKVRISGIITELPTYKCWYGYYKGGFKAIEQGMKTPIFLVSKYKGVFTVHTPKHNI